MRAHIRPAINGGSETQLIMIPHADDPFEFDYVLRPGCTMSDPATGVKITTLAVHCDRVTVQVDVP